MPAGGATAGRTTKPRLTERHVMALGTALSAFFVLLAGIVAIRGVLVGESTWAALHLALAGGATVAIGTFMPHFAITLAGSVGVAPMHRLAAVLLLAIGALGVVAGLTGVGDAMTATGAALALAGVGWTAVVTVQPSRNPLARRHPIVTAAYLLALGELGLAMALGAAGGIGMPIVLDLWANLRPVHAWLALFGAVSLTIFATLVYLAPTIHGARIRPGPFLVVGLTGIALGPLVAALGFALDQLAIVALGMGATLVGAVGQLGYVLDAYRRRGPFRSEHDWRRVSVVHLLAGTGWFVAAVAVSLGVLLAGGPVAGWSVAPVALPMVAGWMLQELVGSWTYLVPSVTPGGPELHAAQRRILAIGSRARPLAWNAGLLLAWIGSAIALAPLTAIGLTLLAVAVAVSLLLLARSLTAPDRLAG